MKIHFELCELRASAVKSRFLFWLRQSRARLNEKRLTVVVVPLSTASTPRPPLVMAVPSAGAGANARIDQISAVDKSRILDGAGKLNRVDMEQVEQALRIVLGL